MFETYNFPDGKMMIAGITGALQTGEQSGIYPNLILNMMTTNNYNLLLVLRGVHLKELLQN